MPQMAPLMWNLIYFFTFLTLMITLVKTYFLFSQKDIEVSPQVNKVKSFKNKVWMW